MKSKRKIKTPNSQNLSIVVFAVSTPRTFFPQPNTSIPTNPPTHTPRRRNRALRIEVYFVLCSPRCFGVGCLLRALSSSGGYNTYLWWVIWGEDTKREPKNRANRAPPIALSHLSIATSLQFRQVMGPVYIVLLAARERDDAGSSPSISAASCFCFSSSAASSPPPPPSPPPPAPASAPTASSMVPLPPG